MTSLLAQRYRLTKVVGRGSMGEVWKATDEVLGREVAVKVVGGARQADPVALKRFQRETTAMANLSHPNVCSIYDAGSEGDRAFMVMELLTGPSVARMIADTPATGGRLPLDKVVHMGAQVARGLAAAHAIGITHRDIKPGNVMLHDRVTKIVDFGIARLENQATALSLTSPAMAIGTAAYMSPEQARGRLVQPPSDIYSLACLLTSMLAGRPPFVNPDPIEVARAHAMDVPPPITNARPETPPQLAQLLGEMLAKRPELRPSATQVAARLTRIETALLGLADPHSPHSPLAATPAESTPAAPPDPADRTTSRRPVGQPRPPFASTNPAHRPIYRPTPQAPTPQAPTPQAPSSQATPIAPDDLMSQAERRAAGRDGWKRFFRR
ncbi:protein kinase domain-containing protein [Propionibacteriaceae bacterium G1746]